MMVLFYNQRGKAEPHVREGKDAIEWAQLFYQKFRGNEVRLQFHALRMKPR